MNKIIEYIEEIVTQTYTETVRSPCAFTVAKELNIKCEHSPNQSGDPTQTHRETLSIRDDFSGQWTIYHDQSVRYERQQFDVAHEMIEQYILDQPHIMSEWIEAPEDLNPDDLKEYAHQIACYFTHSFLINPNHFAEDFDATEGDLNELKKLYPNVSNEVIAYAMLGQMEGLAILTILDKPPEMKPMIYKRIRVGFQPMQSGLIEPEKIITDQCLETGDYCEEQIEIENAEWNYKGFAKLKTWPIFEKKWKRVILFLIAEGID